MRTVDDVADLPDIETGEYAMRVNRTLIYPLHWLRAEEAAETLRPLFESSYGPGVRVVPHVGTNQLLIYIPAPAERERTRGANAATPAR